MKAEATAIMSFLLILRRRLRKSKGLEMLGYLQAWLLQTDARKPTPLSVLDLLATERMAE